MIFQSQTSFLRQLLQKIFIQSYVFKFNTIQKNMNKPRSNLHTLYLRSDSPITQYSIYYFLSSAIHLQWKDTEKHRVNFRKTFPCWKSSQGQHLLFLFDRHTIPWWQWKVQSVSGNRHSFAILDSLSQLSNSKANIQLANFAQIADEKLAILSSLFFETKVARNVCECFCERQVSRREA